MDKISGGGGVVGGVCGSEGGRREAGGVEILLAWVIVGCGCGL